MFCDGVLGWMGSDSLRAKWRGCGNILAMVHRTIYIMLLTPDTIRGDPCAQFKVAA